MQFCRRVQYLFIFAILLAFGIIARFWYIYDTEWQHMDYFLFNSSAETESVYLSAGLLPSVYGDDRFIMSHTKPTNNIPQIFHFMWKNRAIPTKAADNLKAWHKLHRNWTFVFWTDDDLNKLMERLLPKNGLLKKYKDFSHYMMRVDFARYVILYYFGGVYFDLDAKPLKSLDFILKFHSAIFAREPEPYAVTVGYSSPILASNFFMASRRGHSFWPFLMKYINGRKTKIILDQAGPTAVTSALFEYQKVLLYRPAASAVFLAPSVYFDPPVSEKGDTLHIGFLKKLCPNILKNRKGPWFPRFICETLQKENRINWSLGFKYPRHFNGSFVEHSMFGSYDKKRDKKTVTIDSLGINLKPPAALLTIQNMRNVYKDYLHFVNKSSHNAK